MEIEILYPEVCNLFGDLANINYLKQSCPEINITTTHLNDEPLFARTKPDMVYMCSSTENSQKIVIDKLTQYKSLISDHIKDNTLFMITGNALEVFGKEIIDVDKTIVKGLGLLDIQTTRDMLNRKNSLYVGKFDDIDIVGYKSQFTFSYYMSEIPYLFSTKRGYGFNPNDSKEGIRINHFFATYVIGPLFILNPDFAKYLLLTMGVTTPILAYEEEAYDAYNSRLAEYTNPKNGIYY